MTTAMMTTTAGQQDATTRRQTAACNCGCEIALWSMPEGTADHWECTTDR
ncbi:hypothetical protein [Streptomyces albidochromogenes]|nr:hypothetical protein [Streptomyces albidochromogenes]